MTRIEEGARAPRAGPRLRSWLPWLAVVLVILALRGWVVESRTVSSDSMWPTVCAGDRVVLLKLGAGSRADRGDLVFLTRPGTDDPLLKRVVAVAGQSVEIYDGALRVDGAPVEESYVDLDTVDGTFFGPVQVPDEAVFVLGDDRESSVDSRDFGPVPLDRVRGEVLTTLGSACEGVSRR